MDISKKESNKNIATSHCLVFFFVLHEIRVHFDLRVHLHNFILILTFILEF